MFLLKLIKVSDSDCLSLQRLIYWSLSSIVTITMEELDRRTRSRSIPTKTMFTFINTWRLPDTVTLTGSLISLLSHFWSFAEASIRSYSWQWHSHCPLFLFSSFLLPLFLRVSSTSHLKKKKSIKVKQIQTYLKFVDEVLKRKDQPHGVEKTDSGYDRHDNRRCEPVPADLRNAPIPIAYVAGRHDFRHVFAIWIIWWKRSFHDFQTQFS